MASRVMTSGVGRSGSPRPRLMLPGFARSEIFRIMLFSMPRRNGGGWKGFNGAKLLAESLRRPVATEQDESDLLQMRSLRRSRQSRGGSLQLQLLRRE